MNAHGIDRPDVKRAFSAADLVESIRLVELNAGK
jgi:hypothetical protein